MSDERTPPAADSGPSQGDEWVPLREAAARCGVSLSTLRKWRRADRLHSRMAPGPTGERVVVPIAAVERLAAERATGTAGGTATPNQDQGPPRWAIELLSRADARAEALLDRLAQAERERASAERDAAVERHRRERAEAEAAALRSELERLTQDTPTAAQPSGRRSKQPWWKKWSAR